MMAEPNSLLYLKASSSQLRLEIDRQYSWLGDTQLELRLQDCFPSVFQQTRALPANPTQYGLPIRSLWTDQGFAQCSFLTFLVFMCVIALY
jgi:hypothetical protein